MLRSTKAALLLTFKLIPRLGAEGGQENDNSGLARSVGDLGKRGRVSERRTSGFLSLLVNGSAALYRETSHTKIPSRTVCHRLLRGEVLAPSSTPGGATVSSPRRVSADHVL